jgi:hypothetical protein
MILACVETRGNKCHKSCYENERLREKRMKIKNRKKRKEGWIRFRDI